MNKKEILPLESFFIDLNDRSSDNGISETVNELKKEGYFQIKLKVKTSAENKMYDLQLDTDVFTKIKNIQDLPDWVIIKFILADGTLQDSEFKKRILND